MLALKVSAALTILTALGFGIPTAYVATHLLREGSLPTFMDMFPMYGGGLFERWSHELFVVLLAAFAAVLALDAFAGWLLWNGEPLGAYMTIAVLPVEAVFWYGFALPIPPINAVVRFVALVLGWSALR
jgi:hypothetical protein